MKDPNGYDPGILPVVGDPGRRLADEEYNQHYASGTGGHEVPPEVLETLNQDEDFS